MISDTHDEVRGKWLENEKISMDILSPHFFNCIFRKKKDNLSSLNIYNC